MRPKMARSTEVTDWLRIMGINHTVEGTWIWITKVSGLDECDDLRKAGFRFAISRNQFFHVSDRFLPGQMAYGLHTSPVPYPPGKSYNKPGRKPGGKPKPTELGLVSQSEYEVVNDIPPPPE